MVQIVRPGESSPQSRAEISTGVAATAGSGNIAIGQELLSVGRQTQQSNQLGLASQVSSLIDAEGRRIFEESKRAHQSAILLNKMTEATEQHIQAQQGRYRKQVDENGNPTFETLSKDIEKIGSDILDRTAKTIIDPEVLRRFKEQFGNYVANQKITALNEAGKQQLSYSRSSLDSGLGKLVNQAARDNIDQLGTYEQQGLQALQEALAGGVITHEEFEEQSTSLSAVIREAAIQNAIKTNRRRAAEMLTLPTSELGISEETHKQLAETLDTANKSDAIAAQKAAEVQQIDELTEETVIIEQLQSQIAADALREDELLSMQGKVTPKKFSDLKDKFRSVTEKRAKERKQNRELGLRIVHGEDISDVKPSQINSFYVYMVNQRADVTRQEVSLSEEAMLAASIPAPVSKFASKLEHAVKFGDAENASEVLSAYTYIKDRNRPTLESKFDTKAIAIMEHAELLVERGRINPARALTEARESVLKTDEKTRALREDLFKKKKHLKIRI